MVIDGPRLARAYAKRDDTFRIVTVETRPVPVVAPHNANVRAYCARHGYDYTFADRAPADIPIYWYKLVAVLDALRSGKHDYVVWLDSDTIVCQESLPLQYLTAPHDDKHVFIGRDYPCAAGNAYCAGVFIVRASRVGIAFVEDCLAALDGNPACHSATSGEPMLAGPWAGSCYEQGVMNALLTTTYRTHVCELGPELVTNGGGVAWYGPFILHSFGDKAVSARVLNGYMATPTMAPERIVVLLTTTLRPQSGISYLKQTDATIRRDIYRTAVNYWLRYTRLAVVVVENSGSVDLGREFDVPARRRGDFEFICFTEPRELVGVTSKGQHELYAVNEARRRSRLLRNAVFVVKVTGRYYVPRLERALTAGLVSGGVQAVRQFDGDRCEIVGCAPAQFDAIFAYPSDTDHVETTYTARVGRLPKDRVLVLPPLDVPATRNGGWDSPVTEL
jgi:hypothetical protein